MSIPPLVDEETLDPADWTDVRAVAHRMVDDAITQLTELRERPVWRPMPDEVRAAFHSSVPAQAMPLANVYQEMQTNLTPYPMGNTHPRFWGWYMGASNFTGALGDFLAAINGSNLGGGNTAAAELDRQVVNWLISLMGFPGGASGTLTSGGSMANAIGLNIARNEMAGVDVRREGVTSLPQPLRYYASDQSHSSSQKALELLGLGSNSLRFVPSDPQLRMDITALANMISEDRANGFRPACVIATAGTTNAGAIDDIPAIADLCQREELWLHVDGCIGALLKLSPRHSHLVAGIERADSLALDLHKWLHAPFEVGCALVRDARQHFAALNLHGPYLEAKPRGVSAGEFLFDYSYELSRGFKALKIWMSLKEQGTDKFGRLIDQNIAQAHYLTELIAANPKLQLMAPTVINIASFRYRGAGGDEAKLKSLNSEIMLRLQEEGTAVITDTTLQGRYCLRAAIANHRTRREDLDMLVAEVLRLGDALQSMPG